jgi:peptide/nickel transport system ATP-binding protein
MSITEDHTQLLAVRDLRVDYGSRVRAVNGISFDIRRGETVALVGESGSGKTTVANSIIGLLPPRAKVTSGEVRLNGELLTDKSDRQLQRLRGRVVALIPQDPTVYLNPTMRVGKQVAEAVARRGDVPKRTLNAEVVELLERVGLDDAVGRARQYPHELSGGMRQRVLIAIAIAAQPELLIADEPTSALDVTTQKLVLDQLESHVRDAGSSLLIITHDLGVAADRADRIIVMQNGLVVEQGAPSDVLVNPRHEYTQRLLAARPTLGHERTVIRHANTAAVSADAKPILEIDSVSKDFTIRSRSGDRSLPAVKDVSLKVWPGRTLALVGESGSGKTTTLRIALGIENPSSGTVRFEGQQISGTSWSAIRPLRQRFQYVHQNPFASLDPRFSIHDSIVEPLVAFKVGDRASRTARAQELLAKVSLPSGYLRRKPGELSGGQRQRVAIARALSVKPDLLMLDEPVSALDVSVQAQILELLRDLQGELGVTYVFVTHDLEVVAQVAHDVAVMQRGEVVEFGTTEQIFERPAHEYTQSLLEAIPGRRHARAAASADPVPSA